MIKACLYARYSTDKQTESSIDDQFRICRARLERDGLQEVAAYSDLAISGSSAVESRQGGAALLADAIAGRFEVLVLEGLDRLSRDQVEQERIVRRLEHRGLRIIGVADGYDSGLAARKVLRGVRGLINELYLDDLRHKTHRGQSGQIERGYLAGGKCYGYDIVRTDKGSRYKVNEDQARHVRWIFEQYAKGTSAQRIAHELNRQGIPSPRKSTWAVSAIYGSPVKGSGILNNTLYIGQYVWNRSQWIKNPDTGKRQRLERPTAEWKIVDVQDLSIVPLEIWQLVQDRINRGRDANGKKRYGRTGTSLFGGTLRCPHCNGAMVVVNANRYGCATAKDRGRTVCKGFLIERELVDKRLVTMLRENLLSPMAAVRFEKYFKNAIAARSGNAATEINLSEKRLKALEGELLRVIDAIACVGISDSLAARLRALEGGKKAILASLETLKGSMTVQIPNVQKTFKEMLIKLNAEIANNALAAKPILQSIFGYIELETRGEEVWAKVDTAQTLQLALEPYRKVVAGAGFEPTTFGL